MKRNIKIDKQAEYLNYWYSYIDVLGNIEWYLESDADRLEMVNLKIKLRNLAYKASRKVNS